IENRINQDSVISQQLNLWSQGGSEVIRGNLLVIPIEDTVLYVEPVYIESSNETSLPEVKQDVMAYEDHIVMEETFDKSLDKILELIESGAEPSTPEEELEEEPPTGAEDEEDPEDLEEPEEPEQPEEEPQEPILGAEEQLEEFAELFEQYREALSSGNYEKAGKILEELEAELAPINP